MDKAYNPQQHEDEIYKKWEESGFFNPDNVPGDRTEPYAVMMPPPNVTGVLHLGHALENTIMDIGVRYQRMQGKKALLVPGTDHAAVATQAKVEKLLIEEGMKNPRQELGRDGLLERIREFAEESKATILNQIRKMGTSADWSRLAYTFDEERSRAVNEVFLRMYKDGLIYREDRMVNWDPKLQTTVSNDELVRKEEKGKFYYFKYGPFEIGTARPETKFGDKYVVMHPDDERYAEWRDGQQITVEWINGEIEATIIKDEAVDPEFGTGVMTITPWHDAVDFEIAQRHNLDKEQIIGFDGKLLSIAGEFKKMSIEEARPKIVEKLKSKGLLVKIDEDYIHAVAYTDRGGVVMEPQIKHQWFLAVNKEIPGRGKTFKELMRQAVTIGHDGDASCKVNISPKQFEKIYLHWIDNLIDWNISRQIWWGHRVPAFYDVSSEANKNGWFYIHENSNVGFTADQVMELERQDFFSKNAVTMRDEGYMRLNFAAVKDLVEKNKTTYKQIFQNVLEANLRNCKAIVTLDENEIKESYFQDTDTLDTWFSSGMWSFATLGWPEKTEDLKTFHPTAWMQMGHEILFLWMARMILMSTYALDDIPFRDVYIHGILRDKDGKKFSKSAGNGIDPLDVIAEHGTDALRFALIKGITPGADSRFYMEKVEDSRHFVNKLWNITRYVLSQEEKEGTGKSIADKWIESRLQNVIEEVTSDLEVYRFSQAAEKIYEFLWSEFADWYIEMSKASPNPTVARNTLKTVLQLAHPFMPFITEVLWEQLEEKELLMVTSWPKVSMELKDTEAEMRVSHLRALITGIRNVRAQYRIDPAKILEVMPFECGEDEKTIIEKLARVTVAGQKEYTVSATVVEGDWTVIIPLEGVIDVEAEKARIQKEIDEITRYIASQEKKLENKSFVDNAPTEVVEQTRSAIEESKQKLEHLHISQKDLL